MRKTIRIILLIAVIMLVVVISGFVIWGSTPAGPMPEALAALQSDSNVRVTTDSWLTFEPLTTQHDTGFIIYPGGHVDYRSYAPQAHEIAAQGYLTVIVPMPLNLAVLNPGAAADVIAAHPEIRQWAVGGHSLGGSMAANFVYSNPGAAQGLGLWASYPASNNDLSSSEAHVVSISGTLDGLATPDKIAASVPLLPPDTIWVPIEGGNHAQFGWYGDQSGDNPATISRQDQQSQIIQATVSFLEGLK
jgi:Alpha/beta hydrolase family